MIKHQHQQLEQNRSLKFGMNKYVNYIYMYYFIVLIHVLKGV